MSEVDQPVQDLIAKLAQFLTKKVKKISHEARPGFTTREAMDIFIALLRSATSRRQSEDGLRRQRGAGGKFRRR